MTASAPALQPPVSLSLMHSTIDPRTILSVGFALIFVIWAIYTLVVIYHWVRYGHQSWAAVPAVITHLVVTACILMFMVSGFQ